MFGIIGDETFAMDSRAFRRIQQQLMTDSAGHQRFVMSGRTERPTLISEVVDGVAILVLDGAMSRRESWWGVSYMTLSQDLLMLQSDPTVKSVVLCIDSPGGHVIGNNEACASVEGFSKPIVAHTSGYMMSAAYRLACHCDQVFATGSAEVGSIGTRISLLDASKAFEKNGYEQVDIVTGPYKAIGSYGSPVTDEQRKFLQEHATKLQAGFVNSLRSRGLTSEQIATVADGRWWVAADAVSLGLIDGIKSLSEVVESLKGTAMSGQMLQAGQTLQSGLQTSAAPQNPAPQNPAPQQQSSQEPAGQQVIVQQAPVVHVLAQKLSLPAADQVATFADIVRICPRADNDWICDQLKAGVVVSQVLPNWAAKLEKLANLDSATGGQVGGAAGLTSHSQTSQSAGDDVISQFEALVSEAAQTNNRQAAFMTVCQSQPVLYQQYLQAMKKLTPEQAAARRDRLTSGQTIRVQGAE